MKKNKRWFILLAILLFIQIIQIDRSVPSTDPFEDFLATSATTDDTTMPKSLLQKACYDCHSYKTEYPWYSLFAPVSWWLKSHVNGGRQYFNFSIWQQYDSAKKIHKLEECIEEIENKTMPLKSYTWLHPESKLTDEERSSIVDFLKKEIQKLN